MKKTLTTLLTALSLSVAGCGHAQQESLNTTAIKQEGKMPLDLTQQENWCMGRYTFQLPKGAKITGSTDKYDSFDIKSQTNATLSMFRSEVAKVKAEYEGGKRSAILNETPEIKLGNRLTKIVWGSLNPKTEGMPVDTFAFVYDSNERILFTITGSYSEEYKEESMEAIQHLVNNLHARKNNTVPTQAGVCLHNGFIADDGAKYRFSRQGIAFEYLDAPSISVDLDTEAIYEDTENLIDRTTKNLKDNPRAVGMFKTLKMLEKGPKNQTNGPLKGLQWVMSIPLKGQNGISAIWEYAGKKDSSLDTYVQLAVETAQDKPGIDMASIPPREGVFMYNQILNSIKKF